MDPVQRWARRIRKAYARPSLWLATVSTLMGVATGLVTIGDAISDAPTLAPPSTSAFHRSIGEICEQLNDHDRAHARDTRRLAIRLRGATTTLEQRNALLDNAQRSVARSAHELAVLRGLPAPAPLLATHRTAVAAWTVNLDRALRHVERLDHAGTRPALTRAVAKLARERRSIARDALTVQANLLRLGGRECRFDDPIVPRPLTLPPLDRPEQSDRPTGPHHEVSAPVTEFRAAPPPAPAPAAETASPPPHNVIPPDTPITTGGGED